MEKQNQLTEIEKITKQIEQETDFEKIVELFGRASTLVKSALDTATTAKGKLTEIVRELDAYIEKVVK